MTEPYRIGGQTLQDKIDGLKEEARRDIDYLERRIKDQYKKIDQGFPEEAEKIRLGFEAHQKLTEAGFEPDAYITNIDVTVKREELQKVYKAIGSIKLQGTDLVADDDETVKVTLKSEKYPVRVHYTRPYVPNKRCKIVRVPRIETRLVCERD